MGFTVCKYSSHFTCDCVHLWQVINSSPISRCTLSTLNTSVTLRQSRLNTVSDTITSVSQMSLVLDEGMTSMTGLYVTGVTSRHVVMSSSLTSRNGDILWVSVWHLSRSRYNPFACSTCDVTPTLSVTMRTDDRNVAQKYTWMSGATAMRI